MHTVGDFHNKLVLCSSSKHCSIVLSGGGDIYWRDYSLAMMIIINNASVGWVSNVAYNIY